VNYRLEVKAPAVRALNEGLPENVAAAAAEFITGPLPANPQRVGKRCFPPLESLWAARRGTYRILYAIDEDTDTVTVLDVRHRRDAYRAR
jgi:mRNA-degrading endonuclease RelE of RelBE toxin-antitoxin system